jgi:glycosyltransferase involved in cell wall biosynthesis
VLFSIIIPTYNRRDLLRRTLDSVRAQTFTDSETIVVDDGSTDGTAEYLARLAGKVRVVRQSNSGPGAARNAAAAIAAGEYLAFLDSDDMWFPWTLATYARVIDAGSPAVITGRHIDFTEERLLNGMQESPLRTRRFDDFLSCSEHPVAAGTCILVVRRATFMAAGGFTDRLINGEDIDLVLRLGDAGAFVQVIEPITVGWRNHVLRETANLRRSVEGMNYLIDQERTGRYPGGGGRARERRRIITRQVRPVSFALLHAGQPRAAMQLYKSTVAWHRAEGRWRYLGAFPLYWAGTAARSGWRR